MTDDSPRPYGMPAQRTPVQFDTDTGRLRIGSHARPVPDPAESSQVYGAYLSLLYAVRGAQPGEQLALRSADLEALLLIVGDDPETIEQRLIGLMGCTADEATALSRVLLRHRKLTATLGIAAGLSLGVLAVAGGTSDSTPAPTESVHATGATSSSDIRTPAASTAGILAADSSDPVTTSVVLAAVDAPGSGAASSGDRAVDSRNGTADRRTTPTGRRSVSPPTGAAPTVGDGRTATPADAEPAPVAPSPGTGPTGPEQPDTVDDVPDTLPVVPGRPISGTTPLGPGDSSTVPVIVGDDVPVPTGTTPPPAGITAPTDTAPSDTAQPAPSGPTEPAPTEPAPSEPAPSDTAQPAPSGPTDPAPSDPAPSDPAPSDPAPSDPAPTEPMPTEPVPTEPMPTEPVPTEPVPTEPVPTEPAPSDGGSTKKHKGGGLQGVADGGDADKGKGNDKPA